MTTRATTLGAFVIAGALSVVALPAEAGTAYRYWSYWTAEPGASEWRYATEGSGTRVPADGAVEGWRFGVAGDTNRIQPNSAPDFAAICAGFDADVGSKRVAVVVDPGSQSEAPEGQAPGSVTTQCVVADEGSTGLQILQSVAQVRLDAGFVCGIDGYPTTECAPLVDTPDPSQSPEAADAVAASTPSESVISAEITDSTTATGTPLITAVAVSILALLGFGVWRRRRREAGR